ncbi:MAG: hypothetical protein ACO1Q7_08630 [Gemmatimonas sp.]
MSVLASVAFAIDASMRAQQPDAPFSLPEVANLAIQLSALLLLWSVIHADSILRQDAYWRATALSVHEIGVAKFAYFLLLVAIPVIVANAVAMVPFVSSAREVVEHTISAVMQILPGLLAVLTMMVATSTALGFLSVVVLWFAASSAVSALSQSVAATPPGFSAESAFVSIVSITLPLLWLGCVYAGWIRRTWLIRIAACVVVSIASTCPDVYFAAKALREVRRVNETTVNTPGLDGATATINGTTAQVEFVAPAPPAGQRYYVWGLRAELMLDENHPAVLTSLSSHGTILPRDSVKKYAAMDDQSNTMGVSIIDDATGPSRIRIQMPLRQLGQSDRWPPGAFQSKLRIRGYLGLQALDTVSRLTFGSGSALVRDGVTISVDLERGLNDARTVRITSRTVRGSMAPTPAMTMHTSGFAVEADPSESVAVVALGVPAGIPEVVINRFTLAPNSPLVRLVKNRDHITSVPMPLPPIRFEERQTGLELRIQDASTRFSLTGASIVSVRWKQLSYRAFDLTAPVREP